MNRRRGFVLAVSLSTIGACGLLLVGCGDTEDAPSVNRVVDAAGSEGDAPGAQPEAAPADAPLEEDPATESGDSALSPSDGSSPDAIEAGSPDASLDAPDERVDANMSGTDASEAGTLVDAGASDALVFPSNGTTQSILAQQGSDCLPCAEANGCLDPALLGGSCEGTTGTAPVGCAALLGTSSAPSEALVCLATLNAIFTSRCAALRQETPCLCGSTDPGSCLAGTDAPTGPVAPLYACDFEGTGAMPTSDFTNQAFGVGQANALVQCAAIFDCDCFP
jgi:hypothetical protein